MTKLKFNFNISILSIGLKHFLRINLIHRHQLSNLKSEGFFWLSKEDNINVSGYVYEKQSILLYPAYFYCVPKYLK